MKRRELISHLEKHGCVLSREGRKHTVYINIKLQKATTIPRHKEINDILARKICKDLEVPLK